MAVEKSAVGDRGWFYHGSREKYNGSREKHSEGWRVLINILGEPAWLGFGRVNL